MAKACHHGSDDVFYKFLQAVCPAITVISSGDCEGFDHPRPSVVGASATTGFLQISGDRLVSPLVYSTELARSYKLSTLDKARITWGSGKNARELKSKTLGDAQVELSDTRPKGESRKKHLRSGRDVLVVAGLVYGLVNVRSDGKKIVAATLDERDHTWNVKTVRQPRARISSRAPDRRRAMSRPP